MICLSLRHYSTDSLWHPVSDDEVSQVDEGGGGGRSRLVVDDDLLDPQGQAAFPLGRASASFQELMCRG
mgnify:CR=1 FL=1